jgi:hypothetical protein
LTAVPNRPVDEIRNWKVPASWMAEFCAVASEVQSMRPIRQIFVASFLICASGVE